MRGHDVNFKMCEGGSRKREQHNHCSGVTGNSGRVYALSKREREKRRKRESEREKRGG